MCITVFVRAVAEEFIHPRVGEKLHRHRVDLAHLARRALQNADRNQALAEICLERVAGLMRQNVHVCRSTVKVRENERCFVFRQRCAVAAKVLARARLKVKQLVLRHEVEEFLCFGRERAVHFGRLPHHIIFAADRICVAACKCQTLIVVFDGIQTKALCLRLAHAVHCRRDNRADLLAELLHVLGRVVQSAHIAVRKLGVIVIAELLRHLHAHFDELIVQLIELVGNALVKVRPLFKRFFALLAVSALHMF